MSSPQGGGRFVIARQVEDILASRLNFAYLSTDKIFATDISITKLDPDQQVPVSIYFSSDKNGKLDYTVDGTNFIHLKDNNPLKADTAYVFAIFLGTGDLLNLKFSGDATLRFARVGQQT